MDPLKQTLVNVFGAPDVLHPISFQSAKAFSTAVKGAISGARGRSAILAISVLLTADDARLECLAVATPADEIFIFYPRSSSFDRPKDPAKDIESLSLLLHGKWATLVAFGMARIAMHLRSNLKCHVRGIEVTEAGTARERSLSPGAFVKNYVDPNASAFAVDTLWDALPSDIAGDAGSLEHLALRAWLTAKVAGAIQDRKELSQCVFADTIDLQTKYFNPIYQMLVEVEQMEAAKPRVRQNDFRGTTLDDEGNVVITNDRFKSRVRPSERTEVWMIDEEDGLHIGNARRAEGRQTRVAPRSNLGGIALKAIFQVGRDELNHAERARETFLLHLLQGKHDFLEPGYDLIRKLYFPSPNDVQRHKVAGAFREGRLNQSQSNVVEAMVRREAPFVLVHGPPGTGKTSTISAALQESTSMRRTVWVVSQSNVAVKNIAERLSKDEVHYKLLVSKEFYQEWHEDIYDERVKESLIRTDELPTLSQDVAITFHGVRIVLCTLATLSNPSLDAKNVFNYVPVETMVVDEASQIGIFNYMPIFARFKRLSNVCFFGDPKQLPPYGKEAASTLQSIFDVRHLKSQAYFLNIQYRMPSPLGAFISEAVYDGKLRSEHRISSPSCLAFVDACFGEEKSDNKSFVNEREVQTVEHLVRYFYRNTNYTIITPYDAQRSLIQKTLEAAGLPSDNVYNVDSFQGNEADFIILSVVRSTSPGFLKSRHRVNVMLTRCRVGMVIVTSKAFMNLRSVSDTLLGEMREHWERKYGPEITWSDWNEVANKTADLPGVLGRRNKADSHSQKRVARSSILAEPSKEVLAPISAQLRGTLTPSGAMSDLYLRQARLDPPRPVNSGIDFISNHLQRMRLDSASQGRAPNNLRPRGAPPRENARTGRSQDSSHHPHNFPRLAPAPRNQGAAGAWKNGPPRSPRVLPAPIVPSQKIKALKKNVPSESLPPVGKAKKRWESLVLF